MADLIELFPTPLMRFERLVDGAMLQALKARLLADAALQNSQSAQLSHTRILDPAGDELLQQLAQLVTPKVVEFGTHLFGEALEWRVKELWANVLNTGGRQGVHNHANSFVSGVIYLSESHPSARTVFMRGLGGRDFAFTNTNANSSTGPFNADKWLAPEPEPGDMLLFPSYLLHEVPVNQGGQRFSLAFNAIPRRLDAWGYSISFN